MIAGALNFTLGLQANQFLNSLGVASGKLLAFAGIANGIQSAFGKMWGAVQQGGKLTDLAAAASVSVKSLYQLRRGFQEIGASADSVGSVLQRLRTNLSGGQQDGLLAELGLDANSLRAADPAAQFTRIAAALAKLDATARAGASQKLFGREGALVANMIANSGNAFADAMNRAAGDATIHQNTASTFDEIADKIVEIQSRIDATWALLAGGLIAAFKKQQLPEVLTDIISTSFAAGLAMVPAMFVKLGEVLLRAFEVPLTYLQAGIEYVIDQAVNNPRLRQVLMATPSGAAAVGVGDLLGITSGQPTSFADILKQRQAEGLKFNFGSGEFGMGDISASANELFKGALGNSSGLLGGLQERLIALITGLPQGSTSAAGIGGAGGLGGGGKSGNNTASAWERIGFVLRGGSAGGNDHARSTAENTRKTNVLLDKIEKKLGNGTGGAIEHLD